jgi:AcrR family transcriptional regulator
VFWLLAKGGVSAVSTPAIARRVGVTQSAIFKHFPNKQAVWREVMDVLEREIGARLKIAAETQGPRADRAFAIIAAYLTAVQELPAIPALMFADPGQLHGAGAYLRQEITRRFGWFVQSLADQIEAGVRAEEFVADVRTDLAASLAAGIAQSLILRWRVSGGSVDMLAEARKLYPVFLRVITKT